MRRCLTTPSYVPHTIDGTEFDSPESIATADFDGDGDADVFVSAQNQDGWYENLGDGELAIFHRVPGIEPRREGGHVLSDDLDGDQDFDVVVVGNFGPVYWLPNQGGGQFGSPVNLFSNFAGGDHLALADMNHDGSPDLVTALETCNVGGCSHVVGWQMNQGDGSWQEQRTVITVQQQVDSMRLVDLNNDQQDDLVLGSPYCSVISNQCYYQTNWFPNRGDGNFASQPTRIHRHEISELRRGAFTFWEDVDGDGDNDGVIATERGSHIVWVENVDGLGTFSEPKIVASEQLDQSAIAIGDVDNDQDIDVVTVRSSGAMLLRQFDQDTQAFDSGTRLSRSFDSPTQILVEDLNGDGADDVIAVSKARNQMAWFRRQFDAPTLFSPASVVGHTLDQVARSTPIDFDSDGDEDVVVATSNGRESSLEWYENIDGRGTFARRFVRLLDSPWFQVADLDADGDVDLLIGRSNASVWLANNGRQEFGAALLLSNSILRDVVAIDVDGDSDMDLVDVAFGEIAWYENTDSRGSFIKHDILSELRRVENDFVGDFDADGDVDIVYHISCTGVCDTTYTLLTNQGGAFESSTLLSLRRTSRVESAFGDLDGDQDFDMFVQTDFRSTRTLINNGNGSLQELPTPPPSNSRSDLSLIDIDGDGDLDLVEIHRYTDTSSWFENIAGNGQLSEPKPLYQFDTFRSITIFADLNGDRRVDLLTVRDTPSEIRWYESQSGDENRVIGDSNGDGIFDSSDLVLVFQAGKYEDTSDDPISFEAGDWDGDGRFNSSDLVAAFQTGTYLDVPNASTVS